MVRLGERRLKPSNENAAQPAQGVLRIEDNRPINEKTGTDA
jgi:hypothetical protein